MELKRKIQILDQTETEGFLVRHISRIENTETSIARLTTDLAIKDEKLKRDEEIISKLESQLRDLRNTIQETALKILLYQARGHIDIKRLRGSAERLKVCQNYWTEVQHYHVPLPGAGGLPPQPGRETGRGEDHGSDCS